MARSAKTVKYKLLSIDPWLKPYEQDVKLRMDINAKTRRALLGESADLSSFANGYMYFGFFRVPGGWVFREWAPGADEIHLIGEFNSWNRESHPLKRLDGGIWEIELKGENALAHGQMVKIQITKNGQKFDRIPSYIRSVVQEKATNTFCGRIWAPRAPYKWSDDGYARRRPAPPIIYEAHVGMAQEEGGIGTYRQFADNVLPRIKKNGYNTVQLMAIQEHPYYASFGYQVSNLFAPSSWFGDPDDLKYLIDKAHGMGLFVLLDVVHSHASGNVGDGLNLFDGTDDQYFLQGERGNHPAWGTKLFNYGKHEVIHYLLSNLKYWLEEYHFDGFRFDGVTSMLYHNHGLGTNFMSYDQYFSMNTDVEAVCYLQLANELIHEVHPFATAVAEDMSGMPGMCIPIRSGGIGFDYRLAMGMPDYWIKTVKEETDESWDLFRLWYELTNRRPGEKSICYLESHDQALVGDKTMIFRLADAEMYYGMEKSYHSPVIDRAIALSKLMRFITIVLGGEGYLNFMGNEFGHPEWIDFPREGNGWSFHHARRQWSLADNGFLKYQWLGNFDREMVKFVKKYKVMTKSDAKNLWVDPEKKLIVFSKGGLIYAFSFHPSYTENTIRLPMGSIEAGKYECIFSTDLPEFGGFGNAPTKIKIRGLVREEGDVELMIRVPARSAIVLKKVD